MVVSIKIKNYLRPPLPNAKLAFLFLIQNLIVDSSNPCFFATPLMVAPGTESNSCKTSCNISSVHVLRAFVSTFLLFFILLMLKNSKHWSSSIVIRMVFLWLWFKKEHTGVTCQIFHNISLSLLQHYRRIKRSITSVCSFASSH